jgi:glutamate/tyrosine decarboxylase-like PLP-dependent enzyme
LKSFAETGDSVALPFAISKTLTDSNMTDSLTEMSLRKATHGKPAKTRELSPLPKLLDIPEAEMRALGYRAVDEVVSHLSALDTKRVGRKAPMEHLQPKVMEPIPRQGRSADEIFRRLRETVFSNIMNIGHPRFLAFVPGAPNFVGIVGDLLASGFNVFSGSWIGGSSAAAIEIAVIDWLCKLCGLPEGSGGLFVSGGSVANLTALTAARHSILNDHLEGAVAYLSDQTHSSVERALRVIGLLPQQIRRVPGDESFRVSTDQLTRAVEEDRGRGLRPFCVIANAGTVSSGAIDDLHRISEICRANGMWMHVDGAYGAAAVISDEGRALLEGLSLADSLSLDPHKWLFQPIECGCVLLRNASVLQSTFQIHASYLSEIHRNAELNFCDYGIQLTRGFRALKVWMSFQYFGLDTFVQSVEHGLALARIAEVEIRRRPVWEIVTPAQMGIITFRRKGVGESFYRRLHDAMLQDGYALLTTTVLNNEVVLRMCTINFRTTKDDINQTLDWLERLAPACIESSC